MTSIWIQRCSCNYQYVRSQHTHTQTHPHTLTHTHTHTPTPPHTDTHTHSHHPHTHIHTHIHPPTPTHTHTHTYTHIPDCSADAMAFKKIPIYHSSEYWYMGSMLERSVVQKKSSWVRVATGMYLLRVMSISCSVFSASATLAYVHIQSSQKVTTAWEENIPTNTYLHVCVKHTLSTCSSLA